jgi:hypothetical protein
LPETAGRARCQDAETADDYKAPQFLVEFFNAASFRFDGPSCLAEFMPKTSKTAQELAEMIMAQLGTGELAIGVRKDHAYGWQPMIEYSPGNQLGFQRRADEIADRLREKYDLKE